VLQLQLSKHCACNSTDALIATSRALQLQLWTYSSYNFIRRIATQQPPQFQHDKHFNCNSLKSLQLQLNEHSGCNSANASIATPSALQMQLWTCNFYNFYQTNCNSTSTTIAKMASASIATPQSQQLQLRKHSSCNMIITSIATFQNFSSNSKHVNFL
jgi:hypothetical protein